MGLTAPQIQEIVKRIKEKMREIVGDDDFLEKLWEVRKCPEQSRMLNFYRLEPEITELLEQAFEVYLNRECRAHTDTGKEEK